MVIAIQILGVILGLIALFAIIFGSCWVFEFIAQVNCNTERINALLHKHGHECGDPMSVLKKKGTK